MPTQKSTRPKFFNRPLDWGKAHIVATSIYKQLTNQLGHLYAQKRSPEWQAGFEAAVAVLAALYPTRPILEDARMLGHSPIPRVTSAPWALDGPDTKALGALGSYPPKCQTFRLVTIPREHLEWQEARYYNFGYVTLDRDTWSALMRDPEFQREFIEPTYKIPLRSYRYYNLGTSNPNHRKVLERYAREDALWGGKNLV